jgi:hypothetical protein
MNRKTDWNRNEFRKKESLFFGKVAIALPKRR